MRSPEHFARFVLEVCSRMDKVACYEQGVIHPSLIWPEMAEAQWREAVLNAIDKSRLDKAQFLTPDADHHDWVFIARRRSVLLS